MKEKLKKPETIFEILNFSELYPTKSKIIYPKDFLCETIEFDNKISQDITLYYVCYMEYNNSILATSESLAINHKTIHNLKNHSMVTKNTQIISGQISCSCWAFIHDGFLYINCQFPRSFIPMKLNEISWHQLNSIANSWEEFVEKRILFNK